MFTALTSVDTLGVVYRTIVASGKNGMKNWYLPKREIVHSTHTVEK
jgi:hypothetical protein